MVEELEESFGGDFLIGFGFVLYEMNEFPNVGNGEAIIWGELFSGKDKRLNMIKGNLLRFEIANEVVFNNINIVDLDLILYFLLFFDVVPEDAGKVGDALVFYVVRVLVVGVEVLEEALVGFPYPQHLPLAEFVYYR